MSKAVFLDRDGTINKLVLDPDHGIIDSPLNPAQFSLMPRAAEAISNFNSLGLKVIVVSNQPAIAKGKMTLELFERVRAKMKTSLAKKNAHIDAEYYCFHHPQAKLREFKTVCDCRKPKPGLILKAASDFGLETANCYVIGDGLMDIKAGKAVGCKSILIGQEKCDLCKLMETMNVKPNAIVHSLNDAYEIIEKEVNKK